MFEFAAFVALLMVGALVAIPLLLVGLVLKVVFKVVLLPLAITAAVLKIVFLAIMVPIALIVIVPALVALLAALIPVIVIGGAIAAFGLLFSIF